MCGVEYHSAVNQYLEALRWELDRPSEKERRCLERVRQWEELMNLVACLEIEEERESPAFFCRGYGQPQMTPERCLANQLSIFCLPGWPCETCQEGVGVVVKGKSFYCAPLSAQVNQGLCYAARAEARRRAVAWPEGLGWLQACLECQGPAKAEVGRQASRRPGLEAPGIRESGAPALKSPKRKTKNEKRKTAAPAAWLKDATPAVRRAYLREAHHADV